jgi:transcriptional regulator with XRE-family HTH domain
MTNSYRNMHHKGQSDLPINHIRLRSLRERSGFTQAELGELAEISPSHVAHIEAGRRGVSQHVLERLAWALNVQQVFIAG